MSKIQSGPDPILFYSVAVTESSTIRDIKRLPFVGTMIVEAKSGSSLGRLLCQALGLDNDASIDSFEVCIKPKRRASLDQQTSNAILDKIELEGLKKYIIKGKKELEGLLSEFYLVAEGHIGDEIKKSDESSMLSEINKKFKQRDPFFTNLLILQVHYCWLQKYVFPKQNLTNL